MIRSILRQLQYPERRSVNLARLRKRLTTLVRPRHPSTVPIFVLGLQRSGTNMLINVMHLHPDIQVFNEHRNSIAFENHMLRDLDVIEGIIDGSWAPYICFKPIEDSHRVRQLMMRFPTGRFIWIYRNYKDVAKSRLRYFPDATRAIKLVCRGQDGGGWYSEGVSEASRDVLQTLTKGTLSEFDFACLIWWVRNRIFIEERLSQCSSVQAVRYERLVGQPKDSFGRLFNSLGLDGSSQSIRFVNDSSVGKHPHAKINPAVEELCDKLLAELDQWAL